LIVAHLSHCIDAATKNQLEKTYGAAPDVRRFVTNGDDSLLPARQSTADMHLQVIIYNRTIQLQAKQMNT
jgi:hypothetical protein